MEPLLVSAAPGAGRPLIGHWRRIAAAIATVGLLGLAIPMTSAAAPTDQSAEIVDYPLPVMEWAYAPAVITVAPGSWVTWSNAGSETHTVTPFDSSFDSGELGPSEGFSWFFDTPGTYQYTCTLHPWMVGTVAVVTDGAAADPWAAQTEAPAIDTLPSADEVTPEPTYADPAY